MTSFDVVVVGGGPAGIATALELVRRGKSVRVLDASARSPARVGEHLPPRARSVLEQLGAWDIMRDSRALASPAVRSAWGSSEINFADHLFDAHGSAHSLDRARFDELLRQHARKCGAAVDERVVLRGAVREDDGWRLDLSGDRSACSARYVVDASGRRSAFAHRRGARRVWSDRLVALVGWVAFAGNQNTSLLVESTERGWWYSLPLPGERMVVAFMTDVDLLPARVQRPVLFRALLGDTLHTRDRVADAPMLIEPILRAAGGNILDNIAGNDWLTAGDAAFTLDPLSSGGITHALEGGIAAAIAVAAALDGDLTEMAVYADARREIFSSYLRERAETYARETRWEGSTFWRRRRFDVQEIRLAPDARVACARRPERVRAIWRLTAPDVYRLIDLCTPSAIAAEVVRELSTTQDHFTDEDTILAMQMLIAEGALVVS